MDFCIVWSMQAGQPMEAIQLFTKIPVPQFYTFKDFTYIFLVTTVVV